MPIPGSFLTIPDHTFSPPSGHLFIICITSVDKHQSSEFIRILIGLSVSVPMIKDYSVRLRTHTLHFFDFEREFP